MQQTTADGLRQGVATAASDIWVFTDHSWFKVASVDPDLEAGLVVIHCWRTHRPNWLVRATETIHKRLRAPPDAPAFYA